MAQPTARAYAWHVRLDFGEGGTRTLTEADYTEVVADHLADADLATFLRAVSTPSPAMAFASEEDAAGAGNAYCDVAETHPVFGAPGFTVVAARP